MIIIKLENIKTLNNSLQVGDMIYAATTETQQGAEDSQNQTANTQRVGILRKIDYSDPYTELYVDDTPINFVAPYIPTNDDFIMFSKWDQTNGDVNGYYAEVTFVNNSAEKAELFSVGSEVIINSK